MVVSNRNFLVQGSIFRCYVSLAFGSLLDFVLGMQDPWNLWRWVLYWLGWSKNTLQAQGPPKFPNKNSKSPIWVPGRYRFLLLLLLLLLFWFHSYIVCGFLVVHVFLLFQFIGVGGSVFVPGDMSFSFFNGHPYLGKWSNLTNIFQMGWNHQLEEVSLARQNFSPPLHFLALWTRATRSDDGLGIYDRHHWIPLLLLDLFPLQPHHLWPLFLNDKDEGESSRPFYRVVGNGNLSSCSTESSRVEAAAAPHGGQASTQTEGNPYEAESLTCMVCVIGVAISIGGSSGGCIHLSNEWAPPPRWVLNKLFSGHGSDPIKTRWPHFDDGLSPVTGSHW